MQEFNWTPGYGGNGGGPFDDTDACAIGPVTGINYSTGAYVDMIQMVYGSVEGPVHGGSGGERKNITFEENENIIQIAGRCGDYLDSLVLITLNSVSNVSKVYYVGNGGGGSPFGPAHPVGPNEVVKCIRGRSGSYIDQISFGFGSLTPVC